jgi:hypothetical protein
VGAWKLLKKWSPEQLEELVDLYIRCWSPVEEKCTDEQLQWLVYVGKEIELGVGSRSSVESQAVTETVDDGLPLIPEYPRL